MKKRITGLVILSLAAAGLAPLRGHAAGALIVHPNGKEDRWNNKIPILYDVDQGPLGKMSAAQAAAMVDKAIQAWTSIPTASISFEKATADLIVFKDQFKDVTADNVDDFVNTLPSDTSAFIFDNDGGITDHLLGNGAAEDVLAFPFFTSSSISGSGTIVNALVVLNGKGMDGQFDPDDVTEADMTRATEWAVGQFLNLGSSDLNDELVLDGNTANNTAVPLMHPGTSINNATVRVIGGGAAPTLDDQMSLSHLYPGTSYDDNTKITGQVLLPDGVTGLQGIAVIARDVNDPTNKAVEAISGERFKGINGGLPDPALRGAFEIHVPAGTYTVEFRQLREPIGPRGAIFPLPGGRQFYAASSPTAGPVTDPAAATPVTVTAGQATDVKLIVSGKAAPAPQTVAAVTTPHDSAQTAQLVPLSATVNGHVAASPPGTPGQVFFDYQEGRDKIEDLYRIQVPEASILTLRVATTVTPGIDLDLYLFGGFIGGSGTPILAASTYGGTDPETIQVAVDPGTYFIGVSAWDVVQHPETTAADYTLSITTTPLGDLTSPTRPVLNQFVLGNVTDTGADVSWVTDSDAATDVIAGTPQQEFGDPTLAKTHHVTLTGLAAGAYTDLTAVSQDAKAERDSIPKIYFRTADTAAATGPAKLQAAVIGSLEDFVGGGVQDQDTLMVEVAILNTGGPATNVQLTNLAASPGWKLAQPVDQPLVVGNIGSGATAIAVVRLVRDGTGTAPLATVTGGGTLAGTGGATDNFTIGP